MTVPALVSMLVVPLLLGTALLRALGVAPRLDPLAHGGWAWMVGSLGTAALVFAGLALGVGPSLGPLLALHGLAILGLVALGARRGRGERPAVPARGPAGASAAERWLFAAAVAVAVALTVDRALLRSTFAIVDQDEAHLWALAAKVIYLAGGFGADFRDVVLPHGPLLHPDYPLYNPLLQVWTFAHAGEVTHVANRLPIQAFALALVLVLASALRRWSRPAVAAALLLAFVAASPTRRGTWTAHADLMVALGFVAALDAGLRWWADGRSAHWGLACLGLACMLWSKNEGLLYLCALAGACAVGRARSGPLRGRARELGREWAAVALPGGVLLLTWGFNAWFGFRNDLVGGDDSGTPFWRLAFERLPETAPVVLPYLRDHVLLDPGHGGLLVLASLVAMAAHPAAALRGRLLVPTLVLLATFGGYLVVYLGTPKPLPWHLETSAARVTAQALPVVALWLALYSSVLRAGPRRVVGGDSDAEDV